MHKSLFQKVYHDEAFQLQNNVTVIVVNIIKHRNMLMLATLWRVTYKVETVTNLGFTLKYYNLEHSSSD